MVHLRLLFFFLALSCGNFSAQISYGSAQDFSCHSLLSSEEQTEQLRNLAKFFQSYRAPDLKLQYLQNQWVEFPGVKFTFWPNAGGLLLLAHFQGRTWQVSPKYPKYSALFKSVVMLHAAQNIRAPEKGAAQPRYPNLIRVYQDPQGRVRLVYEHGFSPVMQAYLRHAKKVPEDLAPNELFHPIHFPEVYGSLAFLPYPGDGVPNEIYWRYLSFGVVLVAATHPHDWEHLPGYLELSKVKSTWNKVRSTLASASANYESLNNPHRLESLSTLMRVAGTLEIQTLALTKAIYGGHHYDLNPYIAAIESSLQSQN